MLRPRHREHATAEPEDLRDGPPPKKRGLDPYELAVLRGPAAQGDDDGPPPLPKLRIGNLRVGAFGFVVGLLVIVILGSTVRYSANSKPPPLEPDCTTSRLALSSVEIPRGGALRYSVVGPERDVVLAIGAARLGPDLVAEPLPGAVETQVVREPKPLEGCKSTGALGVQVPPGDHTVSVFPAEGGAPLTSRPLTVTGR